MTNPILSEPAARRIVAEVERVGAVRFTALDNEWHAWWRELAWMLETVAEHAWLHVDQPVAADLVRSVEASAIALQDALPQSPPELAGATIQDLLVRRLPVEIEAPVLLHAISTSLRALRMAATDMRSEHERVELKTGQSPVVLAAKSPEDMLVLGLLESFSGNFVDRDDEVLQPTHTAGAKPGPFLRFCEAALSEFAAAWRVARPGVGLALVPDAITPARVRRMVEAWRASP